MATLPASPRAAITTTATATMEDRQEGLQHLTMEEEAMEVVEMDMEEVAGMVDMVVVEVEVVDTEEGEMVVGETGADTVLFKRLDRTLIFVLGNQKGKIDDLQVR